jgi:hypothetical protein
LELLERCCLAFAFEEIGGPVDALFDENALYLDVIEAAADDVGLAVGCDHLAHIGALPHRRELDLIFPKIENPAGRVVSRLLADVDDASNDRLAVQIAQIEHVLADQFRRDRMEDAGAIEQIREEIGVAVEPFGPLHGELLESPLAVALYERGGFLHQGYQRPGIAVGIERELVAGLRPGGRAA